MGLIDLFLINVQCQINFVHLGLLERTVRVAWHTSDAGQIDFGLWNVRVVVLFGLRRLIPITKKETNEAIVRDTAAKKRKKGNES